MAFTDGGGGSIDRLLQLFAAPAQQVQAVTRAHPETTSLSGPRTDDPHGNGSNRGVRVRVGRLSDGTYGVERWLEDGTRQVPTWTNA